MPSIRTTIKPQDISAVRVLTQKAGVFNTEEITIAEELATEAFEKGAEKSGYHFVFYEEEGCMLGYTCFGRIPLTESSYDLYWLVVDGAHRNKGIAVRLMTVSEEAIRSAGGTQVYAETSSCPDYAPARAFYQKAGYAECACQADFYRKGDDKVTYVKVLV